MKPSDWKQLIIITCCCWSKLSAWGFDCSLIASFNFSFSSCSSCSLNRLVSGDGVANGDWWNPAWSPSSGFVCINWANAAGLSRICGGSDWIIFEMLPANPYCAIKSRCYFRRSNSKVPFAGLLAFCAGVGEREFDPLDFPSKSVYVSEVPSCIISCIRSYHFQSRISAWPASTAARRWRNWAFKFCNFAVTWSLQ